MQPSTLAKRVFPLVFLGIFIFYYYGLGLLPLVGPDEPRYVEVAREMLSRGDLVTPTLGGHTWFEKPALLYWMIIGAFKAFGVREWAARLGPATCGVLTVAAIWFVARNVEARDGTTDGEGIGYISAFLAATSLGLIVFSRGATFDIVITMTTCWALSFFLSSEIDERIGRRRGLLAAFFVCVGLSLIAKGLVGVVIPFGVLFFYYALRRQFPDRLTTTSLVWGVPLLTIVSLLWYGPVIARHGQVFVDQFFIQHHFARYLSNKYHHPQPFYFYLPVIALLALPWSGLLLESLFRLRPFTSQTGPVSRLRVFAVAWLLMPLLFFSFSASKLPGYVLPALPAIALLVGAGYRGAALWSIRLTGAVCIVLGLLGLTYAKSTNFTSLTTAILCVTPLILAGAISALSPRHRQLALLAVGSGTLFSLTAIMVAIAPHAASRESVRDLLQRGDSTGYANAPVFSRRGDDRSAEFYAAGRVVYDQTGEPVVLDDIEQMRSEAHSRGGKILVLAPSDYVEIVKRLSDMDVIGDNGKLVLIGVRTD